MIILLNGSFGAGKTSTAEALLHLVPAAMLYDPEIMGAAARQLTRGVATADEQTDDFQDLKIWPPLVVDAARQLFLRYRRPLIVPMTLVNPDYLHTIRAGLSQFGVPVYHFCLLAPLAVLHDRLAARDADPTWAINKANRYAPLLEHERYAVHLDTTSGPPAAIAHQIMDWIADHPQALRAGASGGRRVGLTLR